MPETKRVYDLIPEKSSIVRGCLYHAIDLGSPRDEVCSFSQRNRMNHLILAYDVLLTFSFSENVQEKDKK